MSKSSIAHDPVLLRESLTIKKIICLASGGPWPPTDEFWLGIQADLKDACSLRELRYSTPDNNPHRAYYNIRLLELWPFLAKKDWRWRDLRSFCRRWADARGIRLPPEYDEQADGLTSPLVPSPEDKSQLAPEPPRKRGGGRKHGRYYGPLKRHLKWRKDERDDLDMASLKELRTEARKRLTTDGVKGIPKSRSALDDAIRAALRDLGVNR